MFRTSAAAFFAPSEKSDVETYGLPQVWLTSLKWAGRPREGCRHAKAVPARVGRDVVEVARLSGLTQAQVSQKRMRGGYEMFKQSAVRRHNNKSS